MDDVWATLNVVTMLIVKTTNNAKTIAVFLWAIVDAITIVGPPKYASIINVFSSEIVVQMTIVDETKPVKISAASA